MIEFLSGALAGAAAGSYYWVQVAPAQARRRARRNSTAWHCPRCHFTIVIGSTTGVTAQMIADLDQEIAAHRAECGG